MADPASFVGETVSHYKVLGKLGAGGMGVVYKALDLKLQRTVGLKFLPSEAALDDSEKQHLLQEARAASALDHPNIGSIYGIEETEDGQLFIVMAYYESETLTQVISRGLTTIRAIDLFLQVARGVAAAHARNIVHRDLKPSNILVTTDGIVKIVDFGLARVVTNTAMTQSLKTSGTLPYMSPEQILGEPVGAACDVWALGVVLVQMLTATHPFHRENAPAMTFAILNAPPTGLELLPANICPIAYRALAKQVEHRYPTAKELLADVEQARMQITASAIGPDEKTRTSAITARELKQYAEYASAPRWGAGVPQKTSKRWLYLAVATAVVLLLAMLVPPVRKRVTGLVAPQEENHIAVLPFDNIGGDAANDAMAAGLMDSLTGVLSNINAGEKTLWVVPASVVRSHKINDPTAAAKELGVNLVVKGSIQRNGDDVRMNVDLIDARNLREIGSASLEDRTGDIGTLQNEAVARLAGLMKIKVTPDMLRATGGRASPAAYEMYLKALGLMQRYDKPGNLDQAISALDDAVRNDPQFALGFASLGEAYRLKNMVDPNPKWLDQALANLEHAAQVDDRLPATYVSLGQLHSAVGKHDLALQEFQKALDINPRDADALVALARTYERMGRAKDAEDTYKKAIALRPDYWDGYNSLGFFYYRQNRIPEAIAQFKHVLELTPDNATAYSNLAAMYLQSSDAQSQSQAEAALKRSLELAPSYNAYANLGTLYNAQKRWADAAAITRKAVEMNDHDWQVWDNLVINYEWLHDDANMRDAEKRTLPLLEEFVKSHPQDAGARSSLAIYYAKAKDSEKAQQQIDASLALQPKDGIVLARVAEAYEDMGDRKQAIDYAERSLQNGNELQDLQGRPDMAMLLRDPNFHPSGNPKK